MPPALIARLPPDLPPERVTCRIGLIADTHLPDRCTALPETIFSLLRGVDLLLHAGDVGELRVLDDLATIAPVVAVRGNDETAEATAALPYSQVIALPGARLLLTHAHYPDRAVELAARRDDAWAPKLARRAALARDVGAQICVFGHTHIPLALEWEGVLLVNPGAIAAPNPLLRQRCRGVALLLLRDDGQPFVVHADIDHPELAFVPRIDLAAGFAVAHAAVTASLLDSDLTVRWPALRDDLRGLPVATQEAFWRAWHDLAHQCWRGERTTIGAPLLRDVLAAAAALRPLLATEE